MIQQQALAANAEGRLAPCLKNLNAAVVMLVTRDGWLLDANRGYGRIFDPGDDVRSLFIQPRFDEFAARAPTDGVIYRGLLTLGRLEAQSASFDGTVYEEGDHLLIVAEPDVQGMEETISRLQSLNARLADVRGSFPPPFPQQSSFQDRLLETVPAIILLLNPEGRIVRINTSMERLSGYLEGEVAGKDWFTTFVPEGGQAQGRERFGEAMGIGGSSRHVGPMVTRAGALRQMEWHGRTLTDERGRVTLLCVGHDITEGVAREEGLRRDHDALRESGRRKDEFLAMLGHELRNPLGVISIGLELAGVLTDMDAVLRNRDVMGRQVKQLTRLVDDLLDVSRSTRGTLWISRQRVDLNDIVRGAVDDMRVLGDAERHDLSLAMPQRPVMVFVDPVRMTQVMVNLLGNAAKYTPPGGRIDVAVEPAPEGVRVRVKDNGVGIPPDKLEAVFEMFARVDPHNHQGHGIGLSLSRAFIEMHGGTITAHSAGRRQGSEFVIRIPT